MTSLVTRLFPAVIIFASLCGAARADSAPLPPKGAATFAIYFTGRVIGAHDIGEVGSTAVSEASGLVKSIDGPKTFDNMVEHCLVHAETVGKSVKFTGSCLNTDVDGDKYFHTFEGGPESGKSTIIGGTGKYKGMTGDITYTTTAGASPGAGQFSFTAEDKLNWEIK
jgi:hypothetical protein